MTQNTIQLGSVSEVKKMAQSFGIQFNKDTEVGIVKDSLATKSEVLLTSGIEFGKFFQGLGLTDKDIAIVSADKLMEMTEDKKEIAISTNAKSNGQKFKK